MSMEEAIEQAEIIFDDGSMPALTSEQQVTPAITAPPTAAPVPGPSTTQDHVEIEEEIVEIVEETKAPAAVQEEAATPVTRHHNLRPKRTLRHVQALKQQAKRRKRNANVATSTESPVAGTSAGSPTTSPIIQKVCRKPATMHNGGENCCFFFYSFY